MKLAIFSAKPFEEPFLREAAAAAGHQLTFFAPELNEKHAELARGHRAVSAFVNDHITAKTLEMLYAAGVRLVALRTAGTNQIDLEAAQRLGIAVTNVPAYSPQAVAEFTVAMMLSLLRKLHKAYNRVREGNFNLDGLVGGELGRQTVGIVGTGKIGATVAKILTGFGSRILAYDVLPNPAVEAMGAQYTSFPDLCRQTDVITLHCPLTPETFQMIDAVAIADMKQGVVLLNTSRGKLIDTSAVIVALKSGKIGALGLDVYEEESGIFFENLSEQVIQDDKLSRMLSFPNVMITSHQAFLTRNALEAIATQVCENVTAFEQGTRPPALVGG